jgi:hypothetical protein
MQFSPYAFEGPSRFRSETLVRSCGRWVKASPSRSHAKIPAAPGLTTPGDYELNAGSPWTARKHRSAVLVRSCTRWVPMISSRWQEARPRETAERFRPREECVVVWESGSENGSE